MNPKETIKAAKQIIRERKINKKMWTKEDVLFAKLIKRRAKKKLEEENT